MITIEQVANGFVTRNGFNSIGAEAHIFHTLDEVFQWVLFTVEHRTALGTGDAYGVVEVRRVPLAAADAAKPEEGSGYVNPSNS